MQLVFIILGSGEVYRKYQYGIVKFSSFLQYGNTLYQYDIDLLFFLNFDII